MSKKCYVYLVGGSYDEGDDVRKVFDTREKADAWHKRMNKLLDLHQQYHRNGTVKGSTANCPEIQDLMRQAGINDDSMNDSYVGQILEMNID